MEVETLSGFASHIPSTIEGAHMDMEFDNRTFTGVPTEISCDQEEIILVCSIAFISVLVIATLIFILVFVLIVVLDVPLIIFWNFFLLY